MLTTQASARKRILVIDDEEDDIGFVVECATDGHEALRIERRPS